MKLIPNDIAMAAAYYTLNKKDVITYEVSLSSMPNGLNFCIMSGIEEIVKDAWGLMFNEEFLLKLEEIDFFKRIFLNSNFSQYLLNYTFNGNITGMADGETIFANEPILNIDIPEFMEPIFKRAISTVLENNIGVASKAARFVLASKGKSIFEHLPSKNSKILSLVGFSDPVVTVPFENLFRDKLPIYKSFEISFNSKYDDYKIKDISDINNINNLVIMFNSYADLVGNIDVINKIGNVDNIYIGGNFDEFDIFNISNVINNLKGFVININSGFKINTTFAKVFNKSKNIPIHDINNNVSPKEKNVYVVYEGEVWKHIVSSSEIKGGMPLLEKYVNNGRIIKEFPSLGGKALYCNAAMKGLDASISSLNAAIVFPVEFHENLKEV